MGRKSKTKGAKGERDVAKLFRENGFDAAARGASQSRGGKHAPDVAEVPGYWVESKLAKEMTLATWMDKAEQDLKMAQNGDAASPHRGKIPIIVARRDYGKFIVAMRADVFFKMLKELECLRNQNTSTVSPVRD